MNFTQHLSHHMQFFCVKYLTLSILKILERKKEKYKFVRKLLKLRLNHLFQMINSLNRWHKKLRKIKTQKKSYQILKGPNKMKLK